MSELKLLCIIVDELKNLKTHTELNGGQLISENYERMDELLDVLIRLEQTPSTTMLQQAGDSE